MDNNAVSNGEHTLADESFILTYNGDVLTFHFAPVSRKQRRLLRRAQNEKLAEYYKLRKEFAAIIAFQDKISAENERVIQERQAEEEKPEAERRVIPDYKPEEVSDELALQQGEFNARFGDLTEDFYFRVLRGVIDRSRVSDDILKLIDEDLKAEDGFWDSIDPDEVERNVHRFLELRGASGSTDRGDMGDVGDTGSGDERGDGGGDGTDSLRPDS